MVGGSSYHAFSVMSRTTIMVVHFDDFKPNSMYTGDVGARGGCLSIMVGGEEKIFKKLELPLFSCMAVKERGGKIEYMGESGSGQHTKMVNQILIATTMIGISEGKLEN